MDDAQKRLKAKNVLCYFPDYPKLIACIVEARESISISRQDRENRDKIYETVERSQLDFIISTYYKFQANEEIIKQAARQDRIEIVIMRELAVLGPLIGLIFWYFD